LFGDEMNLLVLSFLGSIAAGLALNIFVLRRISGSTIRAFALALSRAVFYAPAFVHLGHGAYIPCPLLFAVWNSFDEHGPRLGFSVIQLPGIVFLVSLAVAWCRGVIASERAGRSGPTV
jgi:hypothetical protein